MKRSLILLAIVTVLMGVLIRPISAQSTSSEGASVQAESQGGGAVFIALPTSGGIAIDTDDANPGDGNCADASGFCSLRAAVQETNELSGEDRIVLAGSAPFELINPFRHLLVSDDLIIDGITTSASIIDGKNNSRLFYITAGTLRIEDTTLRNGDANLGDVGGHGGAIYTATGALFPSDKALELDSVIITNNVADNLGGALAIVGKLTVENSVIADNTAFDNGGAIWTGGGIVTIRDSTIRNNVSGGNGGGAALFGDPVRVDGSTFHGNRSGESGGAIHWGASFGSNNKLIQSTISDNESVDHGGGIYFTGAQLRIASATITNNLADNDSNGFGTGGGIYSASQLTIKNTIVAGNDDTNGGSPDCFGTWESEMFNLIGYTGGGCTLTGNLTGNLGNATLPALDAKLGPLQLNAGSTFTHIPNDDSPAINAANAFGCSAPGAFGNLTTDQQGEARVQQGRCDIGSAESPHETPANPTAVAVSNQLSVISYQWEMMLVASILLFATVGCVTARSSTRQSQA